MIAILESLFLGFLASLVALFAEALAFTMVTWSATPWTINYEQTILSAKFVLLFVVIEELAKFFFITKQVATIHSKWQGLFHAALIGLGFASIESLIVYQRLQHTIDSQWVPLLGIFVVHVFTSFVIGIVSIQRWRLWITALISLAITISLHTAYNFNIINHFFW